MSDCLIVGAGLIGMLTARELRGAGMRVTVLDRAATGRESSWAGGGILSPLHPWHYPEPVTALVQWSQRVYPHLAVELLLETGTDAEWTQNGLLILDTDEVPAAAQWARNAGVRLELVGRETILRIEPMLGAPPATAMWLPQVAQIRNPRLVRALKHSLLRAGVTIEDHTEATGLLTEGSRIRGVDTNRGRRTADTVIISSGAWSGQLVQSLGVELPVVPVRGQMVLFRAEPGAVSRITLRGERYIIPRRDGRVLVGSTMERVGFDKAVTEEALMTLRADAIALFPTLAGYPIERHWAGLRPGSPTGVPFIGEHPLIQGLFLNAGHFRNGVAMGPASARLLADIMLRRAPVVAPDPYRLGA